MKYFYLIWASAVFVLIFLKDGLSLDNLTHIGILAIFFVSFSIYIKFDSKVVVKNPKSFFIISSTVFAAAVEGFYMISSPVFSSLKIKAGMTLTQMAGNYLIDLLFTIPIYLVIFYIVWLLINKYEYSPWEFAVIIPLGQALGDGGQTFLVQPFLLLFLPYVMINYQAMSVIPFLKIKNLLPENRSKNAWRYFIPIIILPAVYLLGGTIISMLGKALNLQ